ncbi:MAG: dihydroorotate dehydrogenase electron transfer subunit [Lachnospiraceae bacterium]|nr:dihydroorotate dehydrogenase electron transfer subunit [Lachnospiraceae bacterium]
MAKEKSSAVVIKQNKIAEGIYDLTLETDLCRQARPGQFLSVFPKDGSMLLGRPISICEILEDQGALRLVYRVAGKGTAEFSQLAAGDRVDILGTLGNGFPIEEADGKNVIITGGGIGIPPMLGSAQALVKRGLSASVTAVMGYRDELFLFDDIKKAVDEKAYAATEDGSFGVKGNVLDVIREKEIKGDIIFACGPMPMLRALKQYAAANKITAFISLEERMACGVGACLGCVCKTTQKDEHSKVNNSRICTDGPVYRADLVEI